ncbi:CcdC family protein [Laceyella putida]|uniref:CcdC family protein n=1 Tax=Laceyella putida TaxID=110101 RepID=A0ABW2RI28_9BACL
MVQTLPIHLTAIAPVIAFLMASTFFIMRLRASKKPTSAKKIIIPPLGMSTGFLMFLFPEFHIPAAWAILSFLVGALFFSLPLIKTSAFEIKEDQIYLKQSRAFLFILSGLFLVRLSLHNYIEHHISVFQTGSVFFILAFGMLLPWRIAMLMQYKKLEQELKRNKTPSTAV